MSEVEKKMADGCVVLHRLDTWPILEARYRGVCRGQWWPLGNQSEDPQAKGLTEAREKDLLTWPPSEMRIDSCIDLAYVRSYVDVCDRLKIAPLYSLVCSSRHTDEASIEWIEELKYNSTHLGIDVAYGSGSFSFIIGDFGAEDDEIAKFLDEHLNDCGLFNTFAEAEAFMMVHQRALDRGVELEILDGAVPIDLWEDRDLLALRRKLGA